MLGGLNMLKRKEHQALFTVSLAALGYISPQYNEELQSFEPLYKYYIPKIKNWHIDINKIINREIWKEK